MKIFEESINENSVNSAWNVMKNHDIATITAWREAIINQNKKCPLYYIYEKIQREKRKLTKIEKIRANFELVKLCKSQNYGITSVREGFKEPDIEIIERSYIVTNLTDDPNFKENMIKFASFFNQDSIEYHEKGADTYYWIASNDCPGVPIGNVFGEIMKFHPSPKGLEEYFTTIRKRDIIFTNGGKFSKRKKLDELYENDTINNFHDYADTIQGFAGHFISVHQPNDYLKILEIPRIKVYWFDEKKLKLLFVCTANKIRSATAYKIFQNDERFEVRSAGTDKAAPVFLLTDMLDWADCILVMETKHRNYIRKHYPKIYNTKKIVCLYISDNYNYMQKELRDILKAKVEDLFRRELIIN
jgi:predicted protein tyrosine phosphatase